MRASQSILPSPRTEVILRRMSWDHREANPTGQASRATSPARCFRAGSDAGSVQPGAQPVDRVILGRYVIADEEPEGDRPAPLEIGGVSDAVPDREFLLRSP